MVAKDKDKPQTIDEMLAELSKKHNVRGGMVDDILTPPRPIPTGSLGIDYATGIWGVPSGRVIEIFGPPSSGKSTLSLTTAASLQKELIATGREDELILYLDFEHSFDKSYANTLGLNTTHPSFQFFQLNWMEQGYEVANKFIRSGRTRMIIWDSVAVMVPQDTLDSDFDQRTGAMNRGRLMAELTNRIAPLAHDNDTTLIFINHMVEKIDVSGRRPSYLPPEEDSPVGKAMKFWCSMRISCKEQKKVKAKLLDPLTGELTNQVVAIETKVKIVKNKVALGEKEATVRVNLGKGFDNFWTAWNILEAQKKIINGGRGMKFFDRVPELVHSDMARQTDKGKDRPYIMGIDSVYEFAAAHPDWAETAIATARDVLEKADVDADLLKTEDEPVNITGWAEEAE